MSLDSGVVEKKDYSMQVRNILPVFNTIIKAGGRRTGKWPQGVS